jgi:uncharacterized protein YkwD
MTPRVSGAATAALLVAATSIPSVAGADGLAAAPPLPWRLTTSSPLPDVASGGDIALYKVCGRADASLVQVAGRNVGRQLRGESPFASDELGFTLRSAGAPEVWPRAWSIEGGKLEDDDVLKRVTEWSEGMHPLGERRCGVARASSRAGVTVVSVVAVDALADLDPLPTLARTGEWVKLKGHMLVPASEAKVVLLGPRGLPKTVLASLSSEGEIRATFSVDQPGTWFVQVLATVSTGPRPVLEAYVHAGTLPPDRFAESPAPGEDAGRDARDAVEAMRRMVNAARASEGLPALLPDPKLDELAQEHAQKMFDTKTVGPDVGGGDPKSRVAAAGISSRATGENVAAASSLERAHRALWASPSHRGNVLEKRFSNVGIGVVKGPDGRVWVAEIFTG